MLVLDVAAKNAATNVAAVMVLRTTDDNGNIKD